jgi:hypothetical protein
VPRCRSRRSGPLLGDKVRDRTGAPDLRGTGRSPPLRHTHQTAACEILERSLSVESAEASNAPPAPGDDQFASILHALQILTEAIVQLADSDLSLRLM